MYLKYMLSFFMGSVFVLVYFGLYRFHFQLISQAWLFNLTQKKYATLISNFIKSSFFRLFVVLPIFLYLVIKLEPDILPLVAGALLALFVLQKKVG